MITGNDAFLSPYRSAVLAVPAGVARLRGLVADRPDQAERLADLDGLQRTKMQLLSFNIEARRQGETAAANIGRMQQDHETMDRIRAAAGTYRKAELARMLRRAIDGNGNGGASRNGGK